MHAVAHALLCLSVALLASGCGAAQDDDAPGGMPGPGSDGRAVGVDRVAQTSLVALVQNSPAPEGGSTADWLKREQAKITGEVMFPRWDVDRRGTSKYEVRFTYTLIDPENRIVKRGFAWTVDAGLQIVGPPREVSPEYSPAFNRGGSAGDEYKRAKDIQSQLE